MLFITAVQELAMASQDQSRDGTPRQDSGRAGAEKDGKSTGDKGMADKNYQGEGPGKIGLTSDSQPDLVAPSGVNERDHGAADDKPMGGGALNFDDDDMAHPRGKTTPSGGTRDAKGGDSAPLGPPGAGLSDRNGPSDPDSKKQ
jgi:hypothetical protein